jgi:hypothetical protein
VSMTMSAPQERSKQQQASQAHTSVTKSAAGDDKTAHAPVPSMMIASEQPILFSSERNQSILGGGT